MEVEKLYTCAFHESTCRTDMSGELYAPTALHRGKEPHYPFNKRRGGPQNSYAHWRNDKSFAPAGNQSTILHSIAWSLYRLRYPGKDYVYCPHYFAVCSLDCNSVSMTGNLIYWSTKRGKERGKKERKTRQKKKYGKNVRTYRFAHIPGASSPWLLNFVRPQYGTGCMSPFWSLGFFSGSWFKKKIVPSRIHINYENTKLFRVFMCKAVIPCHDLFPTVSKISRKCGEISLTAKTN